ncbi:MAG: hypothetical protein K6A32_01855 [Bacteroidales bacterium]|nr:hypothetical protein [Bacteroidales bacterium]
MPKGELIGLEYTRNNTGSEDVYKGIIEQDSAGTFVLKAMKEEYGPLFVKVLQAQDLEKFRQIIKEEKMYRYKESYSPLVHVYDGWSWSFVARFSDGTKIYSYGSNASPRGEGLQRICSSMKEMVRDVAPADTSLVK